MKWETYTIWTSKKSRWLNFGKIPKKESMGQLDTIPFVQRLCFIHCYTIIDRFMRLQRVDNPKKHKKSGIRFIMFNADMTITNYDCPRYIYVKINILRFHKGEVCQFANNIYIADWVTQFCMGTFKTIQLTAYLEILFDSQTAMPATSW